MLKSFKELRGLSLVPPEGALYIFPRIDSSIWRDEYAFLLDLAREESLTFSPGSHLGTGGARHFRGVFLADPEILADAMNRLSRFLDRRVH